MLSQRLRDECAAFFVELKAASFGRCDIRVDKTGTPYMLEINANCGVYYRPRTTAVPISVSLDPAGHEGFTRQLVAAAFGRHRRLMEPRTAGSCPGRSGSAGRPGRAGVRVVNDRARKLVAQIKAIEGEDDQFSHIYGLSRSDQSELQRVMSPEFKARYHRWVEIKSRKSDVEIRERGSSSSAAGQGGQRVGHGRGAAREPGSASSQ